MFPQAKYYNSDIALVCPNLGGGGTQRVISLLANAWNQRGYTVSIITFQYEEYAYELDPGVHIIELQRLNKIRIVLQKIRKLFRISISITKRSFHSLGQKIFRLLKFIEGNLPVILKNNELIAFIKRILLKVLSILSNVLVRIVRYCKQHIYKGLDAMGSFLLLLIDTPFNFLIYWRVKALRSVIKQSAPPVVVSFLPSANVLTILACTELDTRVIISVRNDPARQKSPYPWNKLHLRYINHADIVTANTYGALTTMKDYVDEHKLKFVPNPIKFNHFPAFVSHSGLNFNRPFILAVGRLHPQKSIDVLIKAFAALPPEMSHWHLIIVGEGDLLNELTYLANFHGVANRVIFTGRIDDPLPYYRSGAIFALPSRHEGMPNALMEAMNYEMPVIVSDASPGPLELVEHNQTGLVVPVDNVESLAQAIEQLINDKGLCRSLGKAARNRVHEHDLSNTLTIWEQIVGLEPDVSNISA